MNFRIQQLSSANQVGNNSFAKAATVTPGQKLTVQGANLLADQHVTSGY